MAIYTPNSVLFDLLLYQRGKEAWEQATQNGITIRRTATRTDADLIISGFWEGDGHCGTSIACIDIRNNPLDMKLEEPLRWFDDNPNIWTTDFALAKKDDHRYQYLSPIIMHEFGHVVGLGHPGPATDSIMYGGLHDHLQDYEKEGARRLYDHPPH